MNPEDKATFHLTYADLSVIVSALNRYRDTAPKQLADIAKRIENDMRDVMGDLDD